MECSGSIRFGVCCSTSSSTGYHCRSLTIYHAQGAGYGLRNTGKAAHAQTVSRSFTGHRLSEAECERVYRFQPHTVPVAPLRGLWQGE